MSQSSQKDKLSNSPGTDDGSNVNSSSRMEEDEIHNIPTNLSMRSVVEETKIEIFTQSVNNS